MRSFDLFKALAITSIANAVQLTNVQYNVVAEEPFLITWSGNTDPVTIFLKSGDAGNLKTVNTIVSGATGQSFNWIPSASLTNDVYALEIIDDGHNDPNYSPQFQYSGGLPAAKSAVASITTASSMASMTMSQTDSMTASPTDSMTSTNSMASTMDESTMISSTPSSMTMMASNSTTVVLTASKSSMASQISSSIAGTNTGKTSATESRSSVTGTRAGTSATPSESGTSDAVSLANPMSFVLLICGAFALLN